MARTRRILVGFNGSDASRRALDAAADLVGYGSTLAVVAVHVATADARDAVDRARQQLVRRHVSARYLEQSGAPAEALADAARTLGADLIVVGRSRQTPASDSYESVSTDVLRLASCDVLVVR
jgi:nucleotide-binding universal stress UspA family protein